MILTQNLNKNFLESCKKNNLEKIKKIIEQAVLENTKLDINQAMDKACRYNRLENIKYLLESDHLAIEEISNETKTNNLVICIEKNQKEMYSYLLNSPIFNINYKLKEDILFKTALFSNNIEVIRYLMVDRKMKLTKETYLWTLNLPKEYSVIKDSFIHLCEKINFNKSLNNIFKNENEIKPMKLKI